MFKKNVERVNAFVMGRTKNEARANAELELPEFISVGAVLAHRASGGRTAEENSRIVASPDLFRFKVEMARRSSSYNG